MRIVEPHQHHLVQRRLMRQRRGADLRQRLYRIVADFRDARDRVALRKDSAESGGQQQIPGLHVRVAGQVGQRQRVRIAGADRNGVHASALDLNRHRVLGIGHQDDLGTPRADARGLSEHTEVVHDGLAAEHTVARAAIDQQPLPQAVQFDIDHLGRHPVIGHGRQRSAQAAQLRVFVHQSVEAHGFQRQVAIARAQRGVLSFEGCAGGEVVRGPVPGLGRGTDRQL